MGATWGDVMSKRLIINWKGDKAFNKALEVKKGAMKKEIGELVKRTAAFTKRRAQFYVPIDTKALHNSISARTYRDKLSYMVSASSANSNGHDYAPDVEYGTFRQAAQPYIRPALKDGHNYLRVNLEELKRRKR